MKNEIVNFIYDSKPVDFNITNKNVMVNATQMAKLFGKEVKHFNENDSTEKFINACLNSRNSDFLGVKNREDLIDSKQKSGTWMHRILAIKFAAWLNPDFEVWVYVTIDKLMNGYVNEIKEAIHEKLTLEQEILKKREEILLKNPEMADFFELENKLKDADKKRKSASTEIFNQIRIDFYNSQT